MSWAIGRSLAGSEDARVKSKAPLEAELRPLLSLAGKSEKALVKVAPGSWQHGMLSDNLKALRLAISLIREGGAVRPTPHDVRAAIQAFESMIDKTDRAQTKFEPKSAQHSLLKNRLTALRVGEAALRAGLG